MHIYIYIYMYARTHTRDEFRHINSDPVALGL